MDDFDFVYRTQAALVLFEPLKFTDDIVLTVRADIAVAFLPFFDATIGRLNWVFKRYPNRSHLPYLGAFSFVHRADWLMAMEACAVNGIWPHGFFGDWEFAHISSSLTNF